MRYFMPLLLGVLSTVVLTSGCGSTEFVNKKYSVEDRSDSIRVAVHPVAQSGSLAVYTDTTLASMFDTTAYEAVPPQEFRQLRKRRPDVAEDIERLRKYEYSDSELEANPGAAPIIGEDGVKAIRTLFSARYLLLPYSFDIDQTSFRTLGYARYRLYDLERDVLVYQKPYSLNVSMGGREGAVFISTFLMSKYNSQFESLLLEQ